jgi:beta-N-acetylhexosaminidase
MLSHIRYDKIDHKWPASLSSVIARDMLRKELGFEGLVLTDDLDMGAIQKHFNIETCVERIFAADIDIALICHQSPKIEKAFEIFQSLIKCGKVSRKKAEKAHERILSFKKRFISTPLI